MALFNLTIYWWRDDQRSAGGDPYQFEAADEADAIRVAHALHDETICIADQSEITTEDGRLVWANEWPIPPGGREPWTGLRSL